MAELILVMGDSGTGKSTSLRNLNPAETIVISPNAKSLPFPGGKNKYNKANKNMVKSTNLDALQNTFIAISEKRPEVKTVILEDFTHFFSARIFDPEFLSRNTGGEAFQRWNDFGASVFAALFAKTEDLREDLDIIVIHHTEVKDDGTVGFKSAGKLLDNTIMLPSYFTWIFHTLAIAGEQGSRYVFQTNVGGGRHAKSPMGAFDEIYVDNDMKSVLDVIHAYNKGEEVVEAPVQKASKVGTNS